MTFGHALKRHSILQYKMQCKPSTSTGQQFTESSNYGPWKTQWTQGGPTDTYQAQQERQQTSPSSRAMVTGRQPASQPIRQQGTQCTTPTPPDDALTRQTPLTTLLTPGNGSLTVIAGNGDNLHVLRWVVGLNVRVDRFFHHGLVELGASQLTPNGRVIASLSKLVGPVQVADIVNQHLYSTSRPLSSPTWLDADHHRHNTA